MKQKEKNKTYLTSRSEVHFLDLLENNLCEISLDWITVNGIFHAEQFINKLHDNNWALQDELDGHPIKFGLKRINSNGELLEPHNIATLIRNKGKNKKQGNWRLETSNHIESSKEKQEILAVIRLFDDAHITRLDIAIDYINFANAGMHYRFYKPNVKQYWIKERNGTIGTIYCGSSGSTVQYRYYDKLKERNAKKARIPPNIKSWERLEVKLRGKNTLNWLAETKKALNYFKCPDKVKLNSNKTDIRKVAMLEYLINHPDRLNNNYLSKSTLAKYRKLFRQNKGLDNSLALIAINRLDKQTKSLEREINSYLGTNKLKEVS
ncbi:replication initiation factor domain-containing protein [Lactobacillus amylovorus]|uniref:replication initiation factor domain-containing protein n=1 Tax=Lactobacillus amylovorus TaxID=1604 RepID=UPI001CCF83ED|nr:replication initiation factor domain-containing protein [Lactobacillus amylovorus]